MTKAFLIVSVACNVWFLFLLFYDRIMDMKLIRFFRHIAGLWRSLDSTVAEQGKDKEIPHADTSDIIGKSRFKMASTRTTATIPTQEAYKAMDCIMSGNATDAQMGSFLTGLRMNHETPEEITGFAKVMRAKAAIVPEETEAIDIVGTGGDLANSFNISTTSAFVIAAAGAKVAKHGNRSVSSKSGAADVLEALGAKIGLTPEESKKCLDEVGAAFLFAQTHHGSMKYAGPVRAQLGVRSVFNILGPLANPAMTNYIVLGVYEKELVRPMADVMKNLGVKRALIVYGDDGLDEISISSTTSVCEINGDEIKEYTIDPEELGLTLAKKEGIVGGTADENAVITKDILTGKEQGAKRDIVLLNAGAALYTIGKAETIKDGVKLAAEMIDSGKANEKLEQFIAYTNVK